MQGSRGGSTNVPGVSSIHYKRRRGRSKQGGGILEISHRARLWDCKAVWGKGVCKAALKNIVQGTIGFFSSLKQGVFLAVSSNTRYQIINGLERIVESSPVAKRVPPIAMGFTVGVRFANNIYGGMQFVDWAKWSGVQ
ncbi:hypothetical protein Taro_036262 [Colocasia esculenta]|uniref:Uncharacterized protein n=1 Tax=Colocasia esculenta TaxID=4460 RepID=A0A843W686_COLES|nr:hypothetical protein [Colocasia esculenta]